MIAFLVAVPVAWVVTPVGAQETGQLYAGLEGEDGNFMISCIHEGAVVFQTEGYRGGGEYCAVGGSSDIPVGVYDVRVEGDGMLTQVKRGVLVTPGNRTSLRFVIELGEGVHTVEYSTGALAREEVAARLRALEEARTALEARVAALERELAELNRARDSPQ